MQTLFKNQPKPFYLIFSLEVWERFGFYTVQGILAYFFVRQLGFKQAQAFYTFGAFSALVYGFVALGGYIGDKVLGTKRTIVLGLITLCVGYLSLSLANKQTIFHALALVAVGNGLFKANPSSLLAKCYKANDARLHGAFTLYYMAINIGSIFALIIGPTLSDIFGWHAAFFVSFIGLLTALVNYGYRYNTICDVNYGADAKALVLSRLGLVLMGIVVTTIIGAYLLQHVNVTKNVLYALTTIIVLIYFNFVFKERGVMRKKMLVAFVLMVEAVVFFTLYQQMPTSLNFFAIHNVHHVLFGIKIDAQSFQVLNPLWIMLMSPVLAQMYMSLHRKGRDLSTAHKFALGMTLCGLSFSLLYFTRFFGNEQGVVSSMWLIASYFFQSVGELLVSALGVAMVAELVPAAISGFIMGMWFLTSAIAGFTGAFVAAFTQPPQGITPGPETLKIYSHVFLQIGLVTLALSIIMWLIAPKLSVIISCQKNDEKEGLLETKECMV